VRFGMLRKERVSAEAAWRSGLAGFQHPIDGCLADLEGLRNSEARSPCARRWRQILCRLDPGTEFVVLISGRNIARRSKLPCRNAGLALPSGNNDDKCY
jgi:hypothetical protein